MLTEPPLPLVPKTPLQPQLPLEIFLLIRHSIPLGDIRTHVCFYRAHHQIAAIYDTEQNADKFWRRVCWHSGIGAIGVDVLKAPHCWRNIALEVIEKDGFCQHPQCGEALLDYNHEDYDGWDSDSDFDSDSDTESDPDVSDNDTDVDMDAGGENDQEDEDYDPPDLAFHRVLLHLAFRTQRSDWYYGVREDAQLSQRTDEERAYAGSVFLRDHPLVQRSFATDLPVNRFCLGSLGRQAFSRERIKRQTGVTVLDVVTSIYLDLDVRLCDRDRYELLDILSCAYPTGNLVNDNDAFRRFRTLRDVLAECHISHFYYDGDLRDGAPIFIPTIQDNSAPVRRSKRRNR